ncbi:MAG: MATE family efflux transporter, partial [Pseudomonadales bacterium]
MDSVCLRDFYRLLQRSIRDTRLDTDSTPFKPASVWTLAWPSIVANLFNALVNLSHIKIVGALGTAAVAAVTTNQRFFFFLMAVLMGLSAATTATVARSWGARQPAAAASYTWNAVWIAVLLTAAISLVVFTFPELFVAPFHLEPEAAEYAAILIRWISVFNMLFAVGMI